MDLQLKDKIIIVSGGAKGIGAAISKALANELAHPIIIGRKEKDNNALVNEIRATGKKADCFTAELTNPEECKNVVNAIIEKFSTIHGLVNNAGVNDNVGLQNGNYQNFMDS